MISYSRSEFRVRHWHICANQCVFWLFISITDRFIILLVYLDVCIFVLLYSPAYTLTEQNYQADTWNVPNAISPGAEDQTLPHVHRWNCQPFRRARHCTSQSSSLFSLWPLLTTCLLQSPQWTDAEKGNSSHHVPTQCRLPAVDDEISWLSQPLINITLLLLSKSVVLTYGTLIHQCRHW